MSDKLEITRRDFLNGFALSLAAGTSLSPLEILARERRAPGIYPPALTGLRGSHPGSFEVAHGLARNNARFPRPRLQTDGRYDMVIVGGGISGLAAAYLYRQRAGQEKRVLVIDNHDDFGGHAKRNEFEVGGETLLCYGGSQSIDTPSAYSPTAGKLLVDLGIDVARFYEYFDRDYFVRRGSGPAIYFDAAEYGRAATVPSVFGDYRGTADPAQIDASIAAYPISADARKALKRLLSERTDYLAGRSIDEKLELLATTSYSDFLRRFARMPEEVVGLLRDSIKGLWGVGWDALPALEACHEAQPGTQALGLAFAGDDGERVEEPYIFHFPDGNASIARALVRDLVPGCTGAATMEALVTADLDYSRLDGASLPCRIRLNSTAVDVRHTADGRHVDVTYVRDGRPERVRTRHAVLACYNSMIPHICPEVPDEQADAIRHAVKIPLVYLSIAVRNWRAWDELGFHSVYAPRAKYMHSFGLDFPVSIGDYRFTRGPSAPTVLHGSFVPTEPDKGLSDREQARAGRRRLLEMSYDEHEALIVDQLDGALGPGGFDVARDVAAITVNRWPHGYAYEYNPYSDSPDYSRANGPHVAGRARIGRISIANSDSSAYAYVDGAIDAADRAVNEQTGSS